MIKIGIAGIGVVGYSSLELLEKNKELIKERTGKNIAVTAVANRSQKDISGLSGARFYDNALEMLEAEEFDIVLELMGGSDGVALEFVQKALEKSIHVVTANKALLAHHGNSLFDLAAEKNVHLGFEAAVGGGIPCMKGLREGLAGNEITAVYGLLNGTSNYILTQMTQTGAAFDQVLKQAQELGYAEADPSFDVGGIDAAHKLSLLASMAFGRKIDFASVRTDGIERITPVDIAYATELGYKIKLLALARKTSYGIEQRVQTVMLPKNNPIALVDDVFNTVVLEGDFIGKVQFTGPGAGGPATASAVIADIIDIAREAYIPPLSYKQQYLKLPEPLKLEEATNRYYLRIQCMDNAGSLAKITKILGDSGLSIVSVLQHEVDKNHLVPVVFTLASAKRPLVLKAIKEIEALEVVKAPVIHLRIEKF
ncbi:MAG: homoserine dehydrogenase [Alphaproteobacteria bacterium]